MKVKMLRMAASIREEGRVDFSVLFSGVNGEAASAPGRGLRIDGNHREGVNEMVGCRQGSGVSVKAWINNAVLIDWISCLSSNLVATPKAPIWNTVRRTLFIATRLLLYHG
ncbi:MAG: hypothetical protein Q9212_002179 [Teloschistes hypoglaucus]